MVELTEAAGVVRELIHQPLLQSHQYDALVCLFSDIVAGYIDTSTPLRDSFLVSSLNHGYLQIAAGEMLVFCFKQSGIQQRAWEKRVAEQYLFVRGKLLF
jgi:GH24 family phage-related lysozyme (muramidase)